MRVPKLVDHKACVLLLIFWIESAPVTIAVALAVTIAVTLAVTIAVALAVTIAVTLAVTIAVTLAVTIAVTLDVTVAAKCASLLCLGSTGGNRPLDISEDTEEIDGGMP